LGFKSGVVGSRIREAIGRTSRPGIRKNIVDLSAAGGADFDAQMARATQEIIRGIADIAGELTDGKRRDYALNKGAAILRDAMVRRTPRADKVVKRYRNGKVVAEYHPGNLRRSVKVLAHIKDKRSRYVGVEIRPRGSGGGVFSGDTVDGWYALFVEYGRYKRPFIRPAVAEAGPQAIGEVRNFVKMILTKNGGSN
jgi:hypothetical protein